MGKYAKFFVALVGVILMLLDHYKGPDNFASQVVLYLVTAGGVFVVPNSTVYRR